MRYFYNRFEGYTLKDCDCQYCLYYGGKQKGKITCLADECVCACAMAVGLYFLLKPYVGTETVSWMCILGAAPFAALGFIKYNGMTAEKFIYAWIKSEFLMPKKLVFHSTNTYLELMKPGMEKEAEGGFEIK